MRLYVYYRVKAEQAQDALKAFREARGESPIELLQRPEPAPDGLLTWMEVYPDGWEHREPLIASALEGRLAGQRKTERFERLA